MKRKRFLKLEMAIGNPLAQPMLLFPIVMRSRDPASRHADDSFNDIAMIQQLRWINGLGSGGRIRRSVHLARVLLEPTLDPAFLQTKM